MLGFGALGEFPLGGGPTGTVQFVSIGWFSSLSEPERFLRTPTAAIAVNNQVFAFSPLPLVSFGWFGNLSEPVRLKPFSPAALYPNHFYQPAPSPFVATGWYNWLSEPVRLKPGLSPHLQKVDTQNANFIPNPATLIEGWFNWFSDPVRVPVGLKVQYQQSYTSPTRVLPPANVTVVINAFEINNDKAAFAINVVKSTPPVTANVAITELGTGGAIGFGSATSVIESS